MAVLPDAFSAGQVINNASSLSWTHTPVGTPDYVRVTVSWAKLGSSTVTATYGGVAMTSVGLAASGTTWQSSVTGKAQIFELIAPPSGAQTVALTFSVGGNYGAAGSGTYTGVHQTVASGTAQTVNNTTAGTTSTLSVPSNVGDMVSDAICIDITNPGNASITSLTAGDTQRYQAAPAAAYRGACQDMPGEATAVIDWSWTGAADSVQVAANILQAAGGDTEIAVTVGVLTLTGLTVTPGVDVAAIVTTGAVTLTGLTVAAGTDVAVATSLGVLTLIGDAVTAGLSGVSVVVDVGVMTLIGVAGLLAQVDTYAAVTLGVLSLASVGILAGAGGVVDAVYRFVLDIVRSVIKPIIREMLGGNDPP